MAQTLTLHTTIVQRETGRIAEALFLPSETLRALGIVEGPDGEALALGVRPGFRIRNAEQLEDFLFAAMVGRTAAWEQGSFNFWHRQRLDRAATPEGVFAEQLATQELVPVSSSPIAGASLAGLLEQGQAWTAVGEWALHHSIDSLAAYIKLAFGIVITRASWGFGSGIGANLEDWARSRLRFPPDLPPRSRPRRRRPPADPPDES